MIFLIPTLSYQRTTQRTALDGADFVLTFDWNARLGRWAMSVADSTESPILSGVQLIHGWPLLRGVTDARRPKGQIYCFDLTGAEQDPGFADLGVRHGVYYFDASEVSPGPQ